VESSTADVRITASVLVAPMLDLPEDPELPLLQVNVLKGPLRSSQGAFSISVQQRSTATSSIATVEAHDTRHTRQGEARAGAPSDWPRLLRKGLQSLMKQTASPLHP
jgi:hypothetical protein